MTNSLPENWEDLIAGYTLGNLSPEEAADLQRLLNSHPELARELAGFQQTLTLTAQVGLKQKAPAALRDKILAAAATPNPVAAPVRQPARPTTQRTTRPAWWTIAGSIAAVGLVAIGVDNLRLRQQLSQTERSLAQTQQQLRESQAVIATLKQANPQVFALAGERSTAVGGAILDTASQKILISIDELPPLPQGQIYRLWAVAASTSEPIFCGQFATTPAGGIRKSWTPAQTRVFSTEVTQLLVTAERADAPKVPQGPTVMQSVI